jgi:release factor glutamine methyltransferase
VTTSEAVADAERRLAAAGVATPRVDAEWIVAHVAGVTRSELVLGGVVDGGRVQELVTRRAHREPLAYVLGEWGFRGLTLKTDARALVPRPETEVVVERCLALLHGFAQPRVLDVGTGTGAIALAIANEHAGARVTGVDTSRQTLELARENADRLRLDVELREAGVDSVEEGWDLVVSNPPYVAEAALASLEPELAWEPRRALVDAGLHEAIVRRARTRVLVLEVADDRAQEIAEILRASGYSDVAVTNDLAGRERVVEGRR